MLTIDEMRELIRDFNEAVSYPQSDFLVTRAFAAPVDTYSHYERVALLDALFSTRLRQSRPTGNRQRKTIFEISEEIRNTLGQLHHCVDPHANHGLFGLNLDDAQVHRPLSDAIESVLNCLNNNSLSFTGKYLHFVFPNLFPLWDNLVPQAINDICDDEIFPENNVNTIDNYLLLCQKYREIKQHFADNQLNDLLTFDYQTQPENWKVQNTLVRILDKTLWTYQKRNAV